MVNIECTRCGATGSGETNYTAKFGLVHKRGCGAKLGIPKYSDGPAKLTKKDIEPVVNTTDAEDTPVEKPKRKRASKKKSD